VFAHLAWNPASAPTRFTQYFALFWGVGLRLGYLATSSTKSDDTFLLRD